MLSRRKKLTFGLWQTHKTPQILNSNEEVNLSSLYFVIAEYKTLKRKFKTISFDLSQAKHILNEENKSESNSKRIKA